MTREQGGPQLAMQVPLCPVTDMSRDMSKYSNDQFGPSKEGMDWFAKHYLRHDSDLKNPIASPQFADVKGLPPTVFVTAELDTLRQQGLEFAKKLEQSGVKVSVLDYLGTPHDFVMYPGYFDEGRDAIDKVSSKIRKMFVENEM
jgi:acetyl esterase